MNDLLSSITSVSASSGVDARFVLATVMQESNDCVRAPKTNYDIRNPGLMLGHTDAGTCNEGGVQDLYPPRRLRR